MKQFLNGLKEVLNKLDVKNSGYKVNKTLTRSAFILMVLYFSLICYDTGTNPFKTGMYMECPKDTLGGLCLNPYYEFLGNCDNDFCKNEYLLAGEVIGEKKQLSIFFETFITLFLSTIVLTFSMNHTIYNKSFHRKRRGV